jgi:hypothetical protein
MPDRRAPSKSAREVASRGSVNFHAIIRLDGPAGPNTVPPAWATLEVLTAAISQAAGAVNPSGRQPARPRPGLGTRAQHPANHHDRGSERHEGRRLRGQVGHQGRRVHRHTRPAHHPRRPARRPSHSRARPAPHRRMHPPEQASRIRRPAPGRLGAHARLQRPFLDQAVLTPPLSARSAPTAPDINASTPWPLDSGPTPVATRSSFSPTGASPDADSHLSACVQ